MQVSRFGLLAGIAASVTLPLAGPVHADAGAAPIEAVAAVAAVEPEPAMIAQPVVQALPAAPEVMEDAFETIGSGVASYYGVKFAGRRTASGAIFDPEELTAAHPSLPFGTQVQVTNPSNGESVVVTITDRGPYHGNRIIDLSKAAAREIGIMRRGSGTVELAVLAQES
ncbi:MAG: septal ring lytic transglycosylase RlpA family protein [Pseudomonadota bacterium]|nr:septal ring lytic transglycosylase RlpA family protein [Pseudomonadota bacterium]